MKKLAMIFALLAMINLSSCMSISAYGWGGEKPYAGTRMTGRVVINDDICDLTLGEYAWFMPFSLLDLPLTIVADTILYPIMSIERKIIENRKEGGALDKDQKCSKETHDNL